MIAINWTLKFAFQTQWRLFHNNDWKLAHAFESMLCLESIQISSYLYVVGHQTKFILLPATGQKLKLFQLMLDTSKKNSLPHSIP